MEKSDPLLRVSSVSKAFDKRKVVDALDLEVREGEVFCILGPSGCGKTTLLRMIAGLENPDQGSIIIQGRAVLKQGKTMISPQRRSIGFVFQDLALWPHLTAAGNLDFVLKGLRVPRADRNRRIAQMLALVRLSRFENTVPDKMSAGEQQRLAVARALVGNPSLLLLDEPLSSLDHRLRLSLQQELVRWLKELKMTTLLITHDQREAMAMADRLAIMHQGRIVQAGTPHEVQNSPCSDFVQDFLIDI